MTALALGMLASASAETTTFTDLSTTATNNGMTYTAPAASSTIGYVTGDNMSTSLTAGNHTQYETSFSFTLDLNAISTITGNTLLVRLDAVAAGTYNSSDYGLWAIKSGDTIQLKFGHSTETLYGNTYEVSSLTDTFTDGTHTLTALTITYRGKNATSGDEGARLYSTTSSTPVINASGLGGSSSEIEFARYEVNTSYVTSFAVTDTLLSAANAQAAATTLKDAVAVPEPATATLSLLALAGLAARRRRQA